MRVSKGQHHSGSALNGCILAKESSTRPLTGHSYSRYEERYLLTSQHTSLGLLAWALNTPQAGSLLVVPIHSSKVWQTSIKAKVGCNSQRKQGFQNLQTFIKLLPTHTLHISDRVGQALIAVSIDLSTVQRCSTLVPCDLCINHMSSSKHSFHSYSHWELLLSLWLVTIITWYRANTTSLYYVIAVDNHSYHCSQWLQECRRELSEMIAYTAIMTV